MIKDNDLLQQQLSGSYLAQEELLYKVQLQVGQLARITQVKLFFQRIVILKVD